MSTPTHDHFTLLYEDEDNKVLHEFKAVIADDVVQHLVDFLKGCGYMESNVFEVMQELAEAYFDSSTPIKLPMQQDDLNVA